MQTFSMLNLLKHDVIIRNQIPEIKVGHEGFPVKKIVWSMKFIFSADDLCNFVIKMKLFYTKAAGLPSSFAHFLWIRVAVILESLAYLVTQSFSFKQLSDKVGPANVE